MTITSPTQFDTYQTFILSGALAYHWYIAITDDTATVPVQSWRTEYIGWTVSFEQSDYDGAGAPPRYTVNHHRLMRAVRACAKNSNRPAGVNEACAQQARNFLFKRDEADFDSDTADQVIQVAAFGEVVYG